MLFSLQLFEYGALIGKDRQGGKGNPRRQELGCLGENSIH